MGSVTDFADLDKAGAMPADILDFAEPEGDGAAPGAESQSSDSGDADWTAGAAEALAEFDAEAAAEAPTAEQKPSVAKVLMQLAGMAELFHDKDGNCYADARVRGHRETLTFPRGVQSWLRRLYYQATRGSARGEALGEVVALLQARAECDGPMREVFQRVGPCGDRLYLDLADDTWRAVEVDAAGWRIVEAPAVRFRRCPALRQLPEPAPGGTVELLRPFVNVASEADWILLIAWLLHALRGKGPFPLLVLIGEQGTAKSTLTRIMRALVDPGAVQERPMPKDDRDLAIAAHNAYILAFGNLSGLHARQSDGLCRLATGGGFATRQLYTDKDETVFDAMQPIILNGIDEFVTRADLADRALLLHLEPIPPERRRPEAELWAEFNAVRPQILGALLDAVAAGLGNLPNLQPSGKLPRMADFAQWARACEPVLWAPGAFLSAYNDNRAGVVDTTLEGDPVAVAVRQLAAQPGGWLGTASDLLAELARRHSDGQGPFLPKSPRSLADKLRRLATFLRAVGVHVENSRDGKTRDRTIRLWAEPVTVAE